MAALLRFVSLLGALIALAAVPLAQGRGAQSQRPTFRADVELIRVDVVVTDAGGQQVRGLTAGDFQILDAGVPREVAAFSEISHDTAERPPMSSIRRDVADNATAASDRLIVLVLDDLHFTGKTDQVKDMARRVVTDLGPHASLALVTTSGTFGVEPTEDRARLLEEIDAFIDKFTPEGRRVGGRIGWQPLIGSPRSPPDLGLFFANMTQFRVLEDVAKRVHPGDGRRKAFIWISGGTSGGSSSSASHSSGWYANAQGGALHGLRRAGVATYGIHTGDFSPAALNEITKDTGGFVIRADRFDEDARRLLADLDHYYLLGFHPEAAKKSDYRPIEVRVLRPGLSVRHRQGYVAGAEPPRPKNRDPLARLAEGVLPVGDLPLRMTAAAVPPAGRRRAQMAIAMEVLSDRAPLVDEDGRMRDVLTWSVWAVDLKRKKTVKSVSRKATLELEDTPESARAAGPVRYQVQTRLELSPGRYQLRASASSERLGRGGSVFLETSVPEYRRDAVELGGILLARTGDPGVPRVGDAWAAPLPQPTLEREFLATDTLRVICHVFAPARAAGRLTVALVDAAGTLVRTLDDRPVGEASRSVDLLLPLATLSGRYEVRVEVDGVAPVRRQVAFTVR